MERFADLPLCMPNAMPAPAARIGVGQAEVRHPAPAPCVGLTLGLRIKTQKGALAVERLRIGDRVLTRDNGYQPVRWIGAYSPDPPDLAPIVRLRPGTLGPCTPERGLRLAAGQRVLIGGPALYSRTGLPEALVTAKALLGLTGAHVPGRATLPLVHLVLDRHELVLCEGVWTESLMPSRTVLRALPPLARRALRRCLPHLLPAAENADLARPLLTADQMADVLPAPPRRPRLARAPGPGPGKDRQVTRART